MVLFIDEIHQLVGAGRTDGAMDAANLLKPALAVVNFTVSVLPLLMNTRSIF